MKPTREQKARAWSAVADWATNARDAGWELSDLPDEDPAQATDYDAILKHIEDVVAPFLRRKAETIRNSPRGPTRNKR